jgi:hypothetical protein
VRKPRAHRQIGVKRHPLKPTDTAERGKADPCLTHGPVRQILLRATGVRGGLSTAGDSMSRMAAILNFG